MRKALTSLSSFLTVVLTVCWGSMNAQVATLEVVTDLWGYEAYWETTPVGDACGVNTILSGGNAANVGCANGGLGAGTPAGAGDPGAYGNNVTIPIALGTAPLSFDFHEVDGWGDGGTVYNFFVDGVLQATVASAGGASTGTTTTINLVAGIPGCTNADALNFDPAATADNGSCIVASCDVVDGVPPVAALSESLCYDDNATDSYTYEADPGEQVTVYFTGGATEACCDDIFVYDGLSNAAPLLGVLAGDVTGAGFTSTSGYLTIEFDSDFSVSCVSSGGVGPTAINWDIFCGSVLVGVPGCTDADAVNFDPLAGATVDDGSCVFASCDADDNQAPVPAGSTSYCYDDNENTLFTYTADPGEQVTVFFTGGGTEVNFDEINVYDGTSAADPLLGTFDGLAAGQGFTSTSGSLTIQLTSDGSVNCIGGGVAAGPLTWDFYCGVFAGVPGCTNGAALNFDENATFDDGSCIIPGCATPPVVGEICYDNGGSSIGIVADVPGIFPIVVIDGGAENGFDFFNIYDGTDNTGTLLAGPLTGAITGLVIEGISDNIFIEITADGSFSCGDGIFPSTQLTIYCGNGDTGPGCTDPTAVNYDQFASSDDGSCIAPEPNDLCAGAIAVACGSVTAGSNILATDGDGLIGSACGADGGVEGPGVWYVFNGTGELVTFSTCADATFDTRITVFEGSCGALNCVTGNDDGPGCPAFTSSVDLASQAGLIYYIYVHGFGGAQGDFNLTVSCVVNPCAGITPPANDDCAAPELLTSGLPGVADLCCSNPEPIPTPNFLTFGTTNGVWYVFDNTLGSFDALSWDFLNLGPAGSIVGVTMYEIADPVAYSIDPCDPANYVAIAGCGEFAGQCQTGAPIDILPVVYVFHVWTVTPNVCGPVSFNVTGEVLGCTDPASPDFNAAATADDGSCTYVNAPANDECANAIVVACNSVTNGSTGAATNIGAPAACGPGGAAGVWYSFTGTGDYVTVALCGSDIDATLAILEGPCGAPVACIGAEDDDLAGCGFFDADDPTITFLSVDQAQYYFYVGGFAGAEGTFVLDVSCQAPTPGCTDPNAPNFDPLANEDNGSCEYTVADACGNSYEICYANFDTQAYTYCSPNGVLDAVIITFGNNSIVEAGFDVINIYDGADNTGTLIFSGDGDLSGQSFSGSSGCVTIEIIADDSFDCAEGVFVLGVNFEVTCEALVFGCTDPNASNFDVAANVDDGSCEYCGQTINYCYGNNENSVFVLNAPAGEVVIIDITNGEFEGFFDVFSVYDGPTIASPVLFSGDGDVSGLSFISSGNAMTIQITSDGSVSCEDLGLGLGSNLVYSVSCGAPFCDNPIACNYGGPGDAIFADCSLCEYTSCAGCTYAEATNTTPGATLDDGSCAFPSNSCPTDINGDGITNTGDLTSLLNQFGLLCAP